MVELHLALCGRTKRLVRDNVIQGDQPRIDLSAYTRECARITGSQVTICRAGMYPRAIRAVQNICVVRIDIERPYRRYEDALLDERPQERDGPIDRVQLGAPRLTRTHPPVSEHQPIWQLNHSRVTPVTSSGVAAVGNCEDFAFTWLITSHRTRCLREPDQVMLDERLRK